LEIRLERTSCRYPKNAKHRVIGLDRFHGIECVVGDQPEELNERQLILGVIDLPAEERDPPAVPFRIGDKLERVTCSSRGPAQDPHHKVGVELHQFLERPRSVIDDLQELRPPGGSHTR
jgi:hypothetical protein